MHDLRTFGLTDLLDCSAALRRLGADAGSLEGAARAVTRYLYENLVDKEAYRPALALARLYKTHRFDQLEPALQSFARAAGGGGDMAPGAPCLTLLGTAGDLPEWNDRRRSVGHQAIPLGGRETLGTLPMVAQLVREIGIDEQQLTSPHPELFRAAGGRPAGVFYVPEAASSPYVPAKEFVERHGIRSVVGFGGLLPSGYTFAVVMFAKVPVPREVADCFAPLAFATQVAVLPFVERRLFDSDPPDDRVDVARDLRIARAEAAALGHLLDTRQDVVTEQAARLERARIEAEDRAEALTRSQRRLERSEATKAAILDAALDAVITMGADGRVLDFNPAAETIFGYSRGEAIGREVAELIVPPRLRAAHRAGLARCLRTGVGPILGRRVEMVAQRADGREFPIELTVASVTAAGTRLFSGHVRDVSERVAAEQELRAAGERYAEIARALQASLLPPALPAVEGADVAALYRSGSEGLDVGGDFYDLFDVGGGRWAVVLGDVMGKGAEAAATTALARYTIRASAIRSTDPVEVLRLLNESLHRDDPDRFCTAVVAFLEPGERTRLSLCSGGHPRPVLRSGRDAELLETPGGLLGPFEEWRGSSLQAEMDAGDLVLFYSDGVLETRHGRELFGVERLVEVVAATAEQGARATVEAVASAVDEFSSTANSDDVALLAYQVVGPS